MINLENILNFKGFRLEPFDPHAKEGDKDYEDFKSIVTDPEIMKTVSLFNCKIPENEEVIKKTYKILTEANKLSSVSLSYKIVTPDGNLMGLVMPAILEKNEKEEIAVMDFGCMMKKEHRGSAALFACSAMAKRSFQLVNSVEKIVASALSDNYGSQAIFLRIGLEYAGQTTKENGLQVNVYELTRENFLSPKPRIRVSSIKNHVNEISAPKPISSSQLGFTQPLCARGI